MLTQRGFTLVELIIALAIISILLALAIPTYQGYAIRTQVTEGMSLAEGAKTAVADYWSSWGDFPADNLAAGLAVPADINGDYVSELRVENGKIHVVFDAAGVSAELAGHSLVLSPLDVTATSSLDWTCDAVGIPVEYVPSRCR